MPGTTDYEQERRELAALLESGAFNRAPNLASLLTYVCQKHFEGKADELKEYSLAVEALGRPADFDNKKDSVVRVEAHRLRKRLAEFYQSQGAEHTIHIDIPSGQYAPRFIYQTPRDPVALGSVAAELAEPDTTNELATEPADHLPAIPQAARRSRFGAAWILFAAALLSVAIWLVILIPGRSRAGVKSASGTTNTNAGVLAGEQIRILAGSTEAYDDAYGHKWTPDRFYEGGSTFTDSQHPVTATRDQQLYHSRREGTFRYDIPLQPGIYELRLYFAETLYGESNIAAGGESTRIFSVRANGKMLVDTLDVISDVGPSAADIRVFKDIAPDRDGQLHLQFDPVTNVAFLNAIEITPGVPGKMLPIRIVARDHPFMDAHGHFWEADRYAKGGMLVNRTDPVAGGDDPELYRGERFGNITYSIPVAAGRYGINLHFAELWFGPNKPGKGGPGDRLFDILCNGIALLRDFDIYKEAGGGNRAIQKSFHNLEPTPQGRIQITFIPRKNYACVSAIEAVDESK